MFLNFLIDILQMTGFLPSQEWQYSRRVIPAQAGIQRNFKIFLKVAYKQISEIICNFIGGTPTLQTIA